MARMIAQLCLYLAAPVLMLVYWRNNLKPLELFPEL